MRRSYLSLSCVFLSAVGVSLGAGCGGDIGGSTAASSARAVYLSYEAGAGGRVHFDVTPIQSGRLIELADRPVNDIVGVPDAWVRMETSGTEILRLTKEARKAAEDEWAQPIWLSRFNEFGRPVEDGSYELLEVRMSLDGVASQHRALRVCWATQGFCTIMDPVVLQLSAFAENRERLLAEGWKVEVDEDRLEPGERGTQATVCSLNSNPSATRRSLTRNGYTIEYKNIYGIVLVRKTVGAQQAGVSCYVSNSRCYSSGFGYSYTSSCFANLGYNCDCANTGQLDGSTQPATRSWAETRCAHQLVLTADVSFSVQGTGASFNVNWTTAGSVDSNGGQIYDSCSFH